MLWLVAPVTGLAALGPALLAALAIGGLWLGYAHAPERPPRAVGLAR